MIKQIYEAFMSVIGNIVTIAAGIILAFVVIGLAGCAGPSVLVETTCEVESTIKVETQTETLVYTCRGHGKKKRCNLSSIEPLKGAK